MAKIANKKPSAPKSPPDYMAQARRRLEKAESGKFDFSRAYASYEKQRAKLAPDRHLAKKLSEEAFEHMYKRVLTNVASAEIAGSAVKDVASIIAQSEVLTSRKEATAQAKAAKKLAARYRASGTPEELALAESLEKVTKEQLLKMGPEALQEFTDKAIASGIKTPGVNYKSGSNDPKHIFWEIFYPPKAKG